MASPHTTHFANWADDPSDCISITSFCIFLIDSLISWRVKKQTLTTHSNTKYEYRALVDSTSNTLLLAYCGFVRFFLILRHHYFHQHIYIMTIAVPFNYPQYNVVIHGRTKHVEIDCHLICQHLLHNKLHLISIGTFDQSADLFRKPHSLGRFCSVVSKLKLIAT